MWITSRYGLILLSVILLLAAWHGIGSVVVLTSLVLAAGGFAKICGKYALSSVTCLHLLRDTRLFPGEGTEISLKLFNRKLLPLPWVKVSEEIPAGLVSSQTTFPGERKGYRLWQHLTSLLWYRAANWKCDLHAGKRGFYPLGPVTVESGDIFGFDSRSRTIELDDHIIVYPRLYPIHSLGLPSLHPMGETRAERHIFQDPTRTLGLRDYRPDDGLRYIHWKATARSQKLQVKVFEPTTTWKTAVFLAVDTFRTGEDSRNEERFELGVSTAASIATHVMEQGSSAGLYVNTRLADSGLSVSIAPSGSPNQLPDILQALAKVTSASSGPFESYLQGVLRGMPWGATLVFVTAEPSEKLISILVDLHMTGHRMLVLTVTGKDPKTIHAAIPWHAVRSPGDLVKISGNVNT